MQRTGGRLLILESHPIQYRVPVYQRMQEWAPGSFVVGFGTDCSTKGHYDAGFGREVAWNVPLLNGFEHVVLDNLRDGVLEGRRSLAGRGLRKMIGQVQPRAVLLNGLYFEFDFTALWQATRRGIPLWLRSETQDQAFPRTRLKSLVRRIAYTAVYRRFQRFFFIGELNRRHYLAHGVREERMRPARYCVANPFAGCSAVELQHRRQRARDRLGVSPKQTLITFCGKLISKKGPDLLLDAWKQLPAEVRNRRPLLFVGSGEMENALRESGAGLPVHFTGFINQRELPDYYLAADVVCLPSRQMGETWGLVINEALHAGCEAIVSSACGCAGEFGNRPRVTVFPAGDVQALSQALLNHPVARRDFHWAADFMEKYGIDAAARALLEP